jgi:glycosyltransferase involved in cell wall biosynthesis
MGKKKTKILLIPSDTQGVGHFRNIWPAKEINKSFGDEFDVEINHQPNYRNIEYFQQFDIVHFHRHIGPYEGSEELFPKIREAGTILVMDIDDYWEPPTTHPLYEIAKSDGISEKIVKNLGLADYITTTTSVFAEHIKKHNENVHVIPNALDMEHKMWNNETHENNSGRCRISWIGGSSHYHDLELMRQGFQKLWGNQELKDKFQIIMCGFDTRGNVTQVNERGERITRKIKPHETVWMKFEEIFTANYKGKENDQEYYDWLQKIKKPSSSDFKESQYEKDYVRRWTLPLTQYGKHYDYTDICLAPLVDEFTEQIRHEKPGGKFSVQNIKRPHTFNEVKSELKIIEAGMKKKVLIAQDFGIYSELIEDGVNGLLVKNDKKDWYKHMRAVILDEDYRNELAENLHNFVKEKYDIANVTAGRIEFYKDILNKQKEKSKTKEKEEVN